MPSTFNALLMAFSGLMVFVGCCLLWYFFSTDAGKQLRTGLGRGERSERYWICFFIFSWLSSLAAQIVQRPVLYAMASGFLAAVLQQAYSFEILDNVRHINNDRLDYPAFYGYLSQKDLDILISGGILAVTGVFLAFVVPALTHYKTLVEPRHHLAA